MTWEKAMGSARFWNLCVRLGLAGDYITGTDILDVYFESMEEFDE